MLPTALQRLSIKKIKPLWYFYYGIACAIINKIYICILFFQGNI